LWIVGEHPKLEPLAGWWASGADDVVAGARFAPTLHHAIADAHVTVATTSARGRTTPVDLTPAGVAELYAQSPSLALVFCREDSAPTREEVVQRQRPAVTPTHPDFPTMNLAQSVGVFCYELSSIERRDTPREIAPAALIERLHERAEALLLEVGFLQTNNPDRIYDDLRAIATRADLDMREAT